MFWELIEFGSQERFHIQVSFSLLIKASSFRAHSLDTNPNSRFSPVHSGIITIIIITQLFILLCLPRIFKKLHRWRPANVVAFSQLVTSPVSSGEWKRLYSSDSGEGFSGIPLTWAYRRNTLWPRVRRGQGRKRPLCRAVSRMDRWENEGKEQGREAGRTSRWVTFAHDITKTKMKSRDLFSLTCLRCWPYCMKYRPIPLELQSWYFVKVRAD